METILGLGINFAALLFAGIVGIVIWVFMSLAHMKALNALGYDKAWIAWIPYGSYYGLADAVCENEEKVTLFGKFILFNRYSLVLVSILLKNPLTNYHNFNGLQQYALNCIMLPDI